MDRRDPGRPQGHTGRTWTFPSLPGYLSAYFHARTLSVDKAYPGLAMGTDFMLGSRQAQGESGTLMLKKKRGVRDPKEDSKGV